MNSPDAPPAGASPLYRAAFVELAGYLPTSRARTVLDQALNDAGVLLRTATAQQARVALFLHLPTVLEGVLRPGTVTMLLESLGEHFDAILGSVVALVDDEPTERMRRSDLCFDPEPETATSDKQPLDRSGVRRRAQLDH